MVRRARLKIGDIVEIPLSDGRRAYAQYVCRDRLMGPMIRVFDLLAEEGVDIDVLRGAGLLFPPIFTGLYAAVRAELWRVVGRLPVDDFAYPKFIWPLYDDKLDQVREWSLWDGQKEIPLGRKLPQKYRGLEQLVGWAPEDVAERIRTGQNPLGFILDR
ncbi:MAG: Imm26 family immunity protein [Anaerolineae bacterium]|nr:Imm26 family immunity protein [Anaerolineae bacterium]